MWELEEKALRTPSFQAVKFIIILVTKQQNSWLDTSVVFWSSDHVPIHTITLGKLVRKIQNSGCRSMLAFSSVLPSIWKISTWRFNFSEESCKLKIASIKQSASEMGGIQKLVGKRLKFPENSHERSLDILKADKID